MDIVERLNQIAIAQPGDPIPEALKGDNWGTAFSSLCQDAIAEIMRLRTALEQVQQTMRTVLDAGLSPPNPSFNDIKQAIKK